MASCKIDFSITCFLNLAARAGHISVFPSAQNVLHTLSLAMSHALFILFCGVYNSNLHGKLFIVIQSLGLGVWVWFGDLG
jgi:hypothetical protein